MRDHRAGLLLAGFLCVCLIEGTLRAGAPARWEYTGDFVLNREIPVDLVAGTAEHPRLVEVRWVRVEPLYDNAWVVTARVGWSPAADGTWSIRVELLDDNGGLLKHSRDGPTTFTGKADASNQDAMRYAEVSLDAMPWEMRRHAAKIRVILEPAADPIAGPSSDASAFHRLVVRAVDAKSDEPIPDAVVVATGIHRGERYRSHTFLYRTDPQGECRVAFEKGDLSVAAVIVQRHGYANLHKSWSAAGSRPISGVPLADLPERHVMEMTPAQTIGGVVQDQAGRPVAHAQVQVEARLEGAGGIAGLSRIIQTDQEGRWQAEGIPREADTISLGFKHPEYIGDESVGRRITGDEALAASDLKHVMTMTRGLAVSGRVVDNRNRPVPQAAVVLAPAYSSGFRYEYAYTLTDASGQFRFGCARNDMTDTIEGEGSTGVLVEVPGYIPAMQRVVVEPNLPPLEFRLKQGKAVTVRVVDEKKRPIPGAWTAVNLMLEDPRYDHWLDDTDEQGRFLIPNTPDHEVQLTIGKNGYVTVRGRVLSLSESEPVITMKSSPRIEGRVVEAQSGKPVSSFEVVLTSPDARRMPAGSSCLFEDGRFELAFDETPPESLQLKVLAAGYKPATSESIPLNGTRVMEFKLETDPSFDARALQRERGGPRSSEPLVIAGTVVDPNGRPVPNAAVVVFGPYFPETTTDAEGKFNLRSPPRASAYRETEREAPYIVARDRPRNLAAAVELDLSAAEDLTIKLAPGVILSGTVTDVQGKGIPSAKIVPYLWIADTGHPLPQEGPPGPDGRYEIRAVPFGHRFSVNLTAEGYGQNEVRAPTTEAAGDRLKLDSVVLRVADLDISGTVVDAEDKPIPAAHVSCSGRGQPRRQLNTDARGRFVMHGVCAGTVEIRANVTTGQTRLYGRVQAEGGATDVKIVISPTGSVGRYVPARSQSLVGKSLPALVDLGIEPGADSYKDRSILLCFFDMNQRPSRNCLTQLAGRADELRPKGVVVIAIQAAEVERSALEQWAKEQGIAVPVGSIPGDAEKATFAWGVRSLPWLILTDATHVVQAEGFAVNELDGKIETVKP